MGFGHDPLPLFFIVQRGLLLLFRGATGPRPAFFLFECTDINLESRAGETAALSRPPGFRNFRTNALSYRAL